MGKRPWESGREPLPRETDPSRLPNHRFSTPIDETGDETGAR